MIRASSSVNYTEGDKEVHGGDVQPGRKERQLRSEGNDRGEWPLLF